MIKLVLSLVLIATLWVFSTQYRNVPKKIQDGLGEVSPSISPVLLDHQIPSTISSEVLNWNHFENKSLGFRLKYPPGISVKHLDAKSVLFFGEGIAVTISEKMLPENKELNQVAEADADSKLTDSSLDSQLIDTISPIAIGSITGITFTTAEKNKEVSYYYVPMNTSYLLITNTTSSTDSALLSLSDDLIYSIDLLK